MKTAKEILIEKLPIASMYGETTDIIIEAMEEYASQFKQELPTKEEIVCVLKERMATDLYHEIVGTEKAAEDILEIIKAMR